jgi:hypothetical protein
MFFKVPDRNYVKPIVEALHFRDIDISFNTLEKGRFPGILARSLCRSGSMPDPFKVQRRLSFCNTRLGESTPRLQRPSRWEISRSLLPDTGGSACTDFSLLAIKLLWGAKKSLVIYYEGWLGSFAPNTSNLTLKGWCVRPFSPGMSFTI